MTTNSKFGRLNDNNTITYAPSIIIVDGEVNTLPNAEDYAIAGWLPIITDNQPTGKVGVYYTPIGWEERNGTIYRTWQEHEIVAPIVVHRYSKLKIITASKKTGKWNSLKEWIVSSGFEDEWNACMYLADDYEGFDQIISAIVSADIATEEELKEILSEAEDDTLRVS